MSRSFVAIETEPYHWKPRSWTLCTLYTDESLTGRTDKLSLRSVFVQLLSLHWVFWMSQYVNVGKINVCKSTNEDPKHFLLLSREWSLPALVICFDKHFSWRCKLWSTFAQSVVRLSNSVCWRTETDVTRRPTVGSEKTCWSLKSGGVCVCGGGIEKWKKEEGLPQQVETPADRCKPALTGPVLTQDSSVIKRGRVGRKLSKQRSACLRRPDVTFLCCPAVIDKFSAESRGHFERSMWVFPLEGFYRQP